MNGQKVACILGDVITEISSVKYEWNEQYIYISDIIF